MTPHLGSAFQAVHLGLLHAASLLVPMRRRAEWRREWRSELWHVRHERVPEGPTLWPAEREVTSFCLGAFRDALCIRRQSQHAASASTAFKGSAAQCIFLFASALAISMLFALALPGVRAVRDSPRSHVYRGLVLIQQADQNGNAIPAISFATLNAWRARPQQYFDDFAFYTIANQTVATSVDLTVRWSVAHAATNLFSLLGVPLRFSLPDQPHDMPAIILGCATFVRDYAGDPRIVGSVLHVGNRNARIAAVLPCGALALPGKVDAWLLEPDSAMSTAASGYVVAHLSARGRDAMTASRIDITAAGPGDSQTEFWADTLEERESGPWPIYLFMVFLAFLSLPAVTSVSMAESSFTSHKPSWPSRLYRFGFLSSKIALLLAIVYFVSLDLAYCHAAIDSVWPQYIELIASFTITLFGMRWIILDQRNRCPVCLRRVSNPASVGDASRTFLAWNGTELICAAGHTLLHVPGLPTSWFGAQRWMYLDTSWQFLFAAPGEG
jgi:hypothetical protein